MGQILDGLHKSSDIKNFDIKELENLSGEIREEIISTVENNGGHLSSNLGIVETTVALYNVFDFPKDKIIFDVGHQCYAHKLISDRKDRFSSIRTDGGISGFPDRKESEYDCFSTGHAGTSISAGLGICNARDKLNENYYVINVVGDGSIINGLNLEALTSSNEKPVRYIVILNDNGMSISINKNGFYKLISKGTISKSYIKSKNFFSRIFGGSSFITVFLRKIKNFFKRLFKMDNAFEKFGFKYVSVPDGNNVGELVKTLKRIKNFSDSKAVLLHIKTQKGKGLKRAEERSDLYHGVDKDFKCGVGDFSEKLGESINDIIEKDKSVVAITAGMKNGTGLYLVEEKYPENFFDVGIAEEFAVTFAGGMAVGGLKPIVAIYSTFLQRAYDQILHDICLQNLPVIFCLDRAGLVGSDGKTHQGVFDLSYLTHIPNMTVLCPTCVKEMPEMLNYALSLKSPVAIRYPKNDENISGINAFDGKWQVIKDGDDLAVLCVGGRCLNLALSFAKSYKKSVKVVLVKTVKPLDEDIMNSVKDMPVITIEDNSVIGGFGALVCEKRSDGKSNTKVLGIKDDFVVHGSLKNQMLANGLTVENLTSIADSI